MKDKIIALIISWILFKSIIKTLAKLDKRPDIKMFKDNGLFNAMFSKGNRVEIEEDEHEHAYNCPCANSNYALAKMIIGICLFVFMFKAILSVIK